LSKVSENNSSQSTHSTIILIPREPIKIAIQPIVLRNTSSPRNNGVELGTPFSFSNSFVGTCWPGLARKLSVEAPSNTGAEKNFKNVIESESKSSKLNAVVGSDQSVRGGIDNISEAQFICRCSCNRTSLSWLVHL
jgi:hypothetical protein